MNIPLLFPLLVLWLCLPAAGEAADDPPPLLIGYTQGRNDLPGGQFENWRTARARVVRADGSGDRPLADDLIARPDAWTQFAGWSPDGRQAIVQSAWESRENAAWEREHKAFRHTEGWLLDACIVDMATGVATNLTAVDRVSGYNSGLFFLPDGSGYGFTAIIDGVSRPYLMGRDGHGKRPAAQSGTGFAYGYSASPDGGLLSYHEDYQIYVCAKDGTGRRKIETGHPFNFAPVWSPDGQWLLFVSGEHENCHPHVVRRDGTGLRKLADRGGYRGVVERLAHPDFHSESSDVPCWSRDSRSIYYTAQAGASVELMRGTLDGAVEQLTHSRPGTRHYHPAASPDGGWILYGSDSTGSMQLHVARVDGRDARVVTAAPPGSAAMHGHWQPAAAPLAARIDAEAARATIGNDAVELAIEWRQGVRLARFRDLVGGVEWIPQPPAEAPGPGPGGMLEGLVWYADDIWPDLAPPSREFLLRYSPGGDLDAAATAATQTLTGATACRLVAEQSRASVVDGVARLDLVFAIDGHPFAVGLHLEIRDGIPAVRRWTSLRNTGTEPCLLHRLTSAALAVRPGVDDLELHWIETCAHPANGPRSPSRWRQATRHLERLGPATRRTLRSDASAPRPRDGSSGSLSWLALRDPGRDCGLYAGWEWSGLFDAEVGDFDTESGAGAFGLRLGFSDTGHYARVLAPNETFTTPKVFFGFFRGDAEEAGRATRHVAERLFGLPWPEGKPPMFVGYCTWSNWQDFAGARHHLNPQRLDEEIRRCRDLGVELFILDYDWFPLLGDFRSDPERFPDGVEAVARKVKAAGMKFGLWMGFGQAHADTPVVREHPELFVVQAGKPYIGGWGMRSLCFAHEPARAHALGEISRIVEAFGVDWLKQDFDIIPISDSRTHCPHATDTRIESVEGYYWIKDRLHERFPRLYLDNWTPPMGGADFGNFQRHHSTMVCDDYHPTAVRTAAHGLAHLLPPQRTHAYLRAFSRAEERSPYAWRSAGFGNGMYVVSDILQWDETTMDAARRQIAEFKESRPLFLDGDIHDLFPDKQPDRFGWDGRLVWSPAGRAGLAQVFRNHDPRGSVRIRLHGLPADGRYVVEQDAPAATIRGSGRSLVTEGIEVAIPAPFTSALLRIRAE